MLRCCFPVFPGNPAHNKCVLLCVVRFRYVPSDEIPHRSLLLCTHPEFYQSDRNALLRVMYRLIQGKIIYNYTITVKQFVIV